MQNTKIMIIMVVRFMIRMIVSVMAGWRKRIFMTMMMIMIMVMIYMRRTTRKLSRTVIVIK